MIGDYLTEHWEIAASLCDQPRVEQIQRIVDAIRAVSRDDGIIFTIGNGGSAATASHFVNDLVLLRMRAVALTDNTPSLMAIANDDEYANVFREQLRALMRPADALVAFSCSGESENVIRGVRWAKDRGALVVGFCGDEGSRLHKGSDMAVCLPGGVQHQEDAHLMLCHAIYCALKAAA